MTDLMIIGKSGQLGAELINFCKKTKTDFVAFGSHTLNITDYIKVNETIGKIKPKIIINTAAFHVVPLCEKYPTQAFIVNSLAIGNLAKVAKKYNSKLVTFSTDYVFDGKKGKPYLETDSPNPLQVYGQSKLAGEQAALTVYPEGVYIIRTCGVYGGKSGSKSKKGNFVLTILKDAKAPWTLEISSEQIVNPTYAKHLAKATVGLLDLNPSPGVYHLTNEGSMSWYEFAKEIINYARLKNKIVPIDRKGKDGKIRRPEYSALANTKAKKLGIVLPSIEDGLKEYLAEIL